VLGGAVYALVPAGWSSSGAVAVLDGLPATKSLTHDAMGS
jgi:hypothetical protein